MSLMLPKDFGKGWLGHIDYDKSPGKWGPNSNPEYDSYLKHFNSTHQEEMGEGGFTQHGPSHWMGHHNHYSNAHYTVADFPQRVAPGDSRPHGFVHKLENGLLVHTTWAPDSRSHYGHEHTMDVPKGQEDGDGSHSFTASIKVRHDPKLHGHEAPINFEKRAFEPQSFFDDGDYSHRLEAGPLTPRMHRAALRDISQLHPMSHDEERLHEAWRWHQHETYLDHAGPVPKWFEKEAS